MTQGLGLGPLVVEDCLSPLRMPKMDASGGGAFVAAFAVRLDRETPPAHLRAVELDLVIGENYLVTVRDGPVREIEEGLELRLRSMGDEAWSAGCGGGSGERLAHAALDALVDGHLPGLVSVATTAEELEEGLDPRNERASTAALENLILLRRDLSAFRRLAVAQQESLKRLGRWPRSQRGRLSDVADNQREAVDMGDATRDYVDGAVESYRMRRDERSEVGIRRLTVLAGIIGPLTLLAGWWGANFESIPGSGSEWGFTIFVGVQLVFVALAVWLMSRRGLL
ncbi:magnesium transporter CorA family protein [Rubrobacter aplysinae]|uniref:magnesium transporter CorA family protein n=1 Tax=Rubrobacter aplysinae TaxID=909625 RepID=UPI00064BE34B|nr:CorA family divalent cation transporter [Rubrobacter aplysinae]